MYKTKTNILFLIPSLIFRGAEKMMVSLANRLDRHHFSSDVVSLSGDNPLADQIQPGAAHFTPLPRRTRFDLRPAFQLRKIVVQDEIDSILIQDIFSFFYIWLALWGIRAKPKVFISIHNSRFNSFKDLLKNLLIARLLSGRELFISVCNSQADYWSATYRIPRKQFSTIYNGVDTNLFCPEAGSNLRDKTRAWLRVPEDAFVILQVASLTPEKRHEDSLAALKYLIDMHASIPSFLVLVGHGTEARTKRLKQIACDLGVFDRVAFCGIQNDVRPFYAAADVFTLTSCTEALSVSALEAMSMGLPCILTKVGGAREMIVEGMNGYLVPPKNPRSIANGWMSICENKERFDREKIRAWVIEHFSLSDCVHQYEKLLQR